MDGKLVGKAQNGQLPQYVSAVRDKIKHRRRNRVVHACFPCRERKVRCDGQIPCANCRRRHQEDFCMVISRESPKFHSNQAMSKLHTEAALSPPKVLPRCSNCGYTLSSSASPTCSTTHNNDDALVEQIQKLQGSIGSLSPLLEWQHGIEDNQDIQDNHGIQDTYASGGLSNGTAFHSGGFVTTEVPKRTRCIEESSGAIISLGGWSDPPVVLGCRRLDYHTALEGVFAGGLTPKTYPFANIWRSEIMPQELYQALPTSSDILRYWKAFRNFVHPLYPVIVTIESFERELFQFLQKEPWIDPNTDKTDSSWLALLFAVVGCGVQVSGDKAKERDLHSKIFICSSFQALRLSNLFNNPNTNHVQTLALVGHCLRNNMDANTAWILIGLTLRVATSLGLQDEEQADAIPPYSSLTEPSQHEKNQIWWMLLWQDTILSMSYGRLPNPAKSIIPYDGDVPGQRSFRESIFTLIAMYHEQQVPENARQDEQQTMVEVADYRAGLEEIFQDATGHLKHASCCHTLEHHLERLTLAIQVRYAVCRSHWIGRERHAGISIVDSIPADFVLTACCVVQDFLHLHSLAIRVSHSWSCIHATISCAMMLRRLVSTGKTGDEMREASLLINMLLHALEVDLEESSWLDDYSNIRHCGPVAQALRALREYDEPGGGDPYLSQR